MSQCSDIQGLSIEEILEKLRSQAQILPPSPTSVRYLRTLESLKSSVVSNATLRAGAPYCDPGTAFRTNITDWLVNLWLLGTPFSTVSLSLDIISALYGSAVKAGQLPSTDIFTELKAELKTLGAKGWNGGVNEEIFARALRLTKNANRLLLDDSIAADLVIWSLTHDLLPLADIAQLKREDPAHPSTQQALPEIYEDDPVARTIIGRQCHSARRKYIFPLRQSERTPNQLSRHVVKIVNALFRRARLPQSTDPNRTVEALWAFAALRAGVPGSTLVRHLGHAPLGLPVLKLYKSLVLSLKSSDDGEILSSNENKSSVLSLKSSDDGENFSQIGRVFLDNPARWYAMSLRPGVRFTQVCRRIQLLTSSNVQHSTFDTPLELFYPCEEIARAIGKKIVVKQRPFIHSVVFFRAKLTDIGPLFARIGDLAWCYRQSARPGAPYAEITQSQFHLFQQTIARFTPDYEVASTGELELKKDDRVEIVGGLFAGHEASFDSVAHGTESAPTVYRLNIIGDNGIEWRISVDSRLAK